MLRKILEHNGLFVVEAATGNLAIQFLADRTPDIVCLDLMLPELSGFDICAFMRKERRFDKVPVLVISGRLLPEDQAQAEELGASAYLTKPFKPAQLTSWLKKLLPGLEKK
jgi:two-component system chemotaxis response regulator CheY